MAEPICKRCIHHDICESYSDFDIITFFPYNEDCEYFKSTADMAEVRRGAIIETIKNGKMNRVFSCCNTDCTQLTSWVTPNYCPNCGAEMDGKGEGE